jgi:hypothetical protein
LARFPLLRFDAQRLVLLAGGPASALHPMQMSVREAASMQPWTPSPVRQLEAVSICSERLEFLR